MRAKTLEPAGPVSSNEALRARDERIRQAGKISTLLGEEVIGLSAEMQNFGRHPRRLRRISGGVVQVSMARGQVVVSPLLAEKVERDGREMLDGYRFVTPARLHPRVARLGIEAGVFDGPNTLTPITPDYNMVVRHEAGVVTDIDVSNAGFLDYMRAALYEPNKAYRNFMDSQPNYNPNADGPPELDEIHDHFARAMERGIGWDYPAELYEQPLGLVRAARAELSGQTD